MHLQLDSNSEPKSEKHESCADEQRKAAAGSVCDSKQVEQRRFQFFHYACIATSILRGKLKESKRLDLNLL